MATSLRRRVVITAGFAVAAVAAPLSITLTALATPSGPGTPLADCPAGMISDPISGSCSAQPQHPVQVKPPGGLGSVDGVPCTGHNMGKCIGLSENQ